MATLATPGTLSLTLTTFAPTVTVSGLRLLVAGVDRIGVLKRGTLKHRVTADGHQGVLDCVFINFKPADNDTITLSLGGTTIYSGHVRSIDLNEYKPTKYFTSVSAQDDAVAFTSLGASPWAFSDTPNNTTTFAYLSLKMKTVSANSEGSTTTGTITTRKSGLVCGQIVNVTSANNGLVASPLNIVALETAWDIDNVPTYTVTVGASPILFVDALTNSINDSVNTAAATLAQTLKAPVVVSALPTLPDDNYPVGTLAYLTTDGKIYRSNGSAWSKAVDGADILVSSITAGSIQAGAIGAQALAADIVLASNIKTASSGRRVEMNSTGVNLYDTDDSPLVKVPTNGDPVYVKGTIDASSLVSETTAEFRTAASLATGAILTAQNGVVAPITAPTVAASVDSLTFNTSPAGVSTANGIAYDSGAGTFWVAADPTTSTVVAHEFNATTGAFVRSIPSTGSLTTTTTTYGSTSHISDTAQATTGTSDSQVATNIVMPRDGRITKVSVYMAGYGGACTAKVAVWNTSGTSLRESASFSAVSETFSVGNSDHYNQTLTSSLTVTGGTTYRVGFLRTSSADGFQWDRDDGSGHNTYRGDGLDGNMSGTATDTTHKPNVYITYDYDTNTLLETAKNVGVATDGTYVYTLDANGVVWKYNRTTMAWVANSAVLSLTGTLANNGLFYDATAAKLVITHATGTTGTDKVKFSLVDPAALTISSTLSDTTFPIAGATSIIRGGARVADALNGAVDEYWVPVSGTVRAYLASTGANVINRDFGSTATTQNGLTYDGTQFRGWTVGTPTKVWKFSAWDWTTASAIYWVAYSWYDGVGTTHETAVSPRTSATLRRRERIQVTNPTIPVGGVDDPNNARIYMLPNATDPGAGGFKLQVTDALTSRYFITYASAGAADGAGLAFVAGGAAQIKSAATGWTLKGSGLMSFGGSSFPASPSTSDQFYRTDLNLWFYYDGTRWVTTTLFTASSGVEANSATYAVSFAASGNRVLICNLFPHAGTDVWIDTITFPAAISSGGTALDASNKWVMTFEKGTAIASPATSIGTISVASGASNVYRTDTKLTVSALLGLANPVISMDITKTGTPGAFNILAPFTVYYRIVQT